LQLTHHVLLAHGQACLALRAGAKGKCSVGVAENYDIYIPLIETSDHIAAARRAFVNSSVNGGILMPLLKGRYADDWLEAQKENAPRVADSDHKLMGQPIDVLGSNCYLGNYVRAADNEKGYEVVGTEREFPRMNISWLRIVPESCYWGVRLVGESAGKPELPVIFTENGCPDGAQPDANGNVVDADRIMFVRAYLHHAQRAVREGYPLKGYFYWSLLDNYEWAEGYNKRFGIIRTDYATQRRIPKASYHWYQEVIRQGRLV
jgi:beta-glucosidase